MQEVLNYYKNDRGDVLLLKNEDGSFCLLRRIRHHIDIGVPDFCRFKSWNYTDLDFATATYTDHVYSLNGMPVRCNCSFYPKNIRRCKAKQCPKKLGGEAYWRLFRESCLYRSR